MACWPLGDPAAIMTGDLAGRYAGIKGLHIVPAGFILPCIALGVSFTLSAFNTIHDEKIATIILPFPPLLLWKRMPVIMY